MTRKLSVYDYLATGTDNDGVVIDFDTENIENIRDQYALMTDEEKPNSSLLKELAKKLNINDDQKNLELLRLCIEEETIEGAKIEIGQRYYQEKDKHSSKKISSPSTAVDTHPINEINCLIQMKINHEEMTKFFKDYLLRSLDQQISSEYTEKNKIHPLNRRCILDLFIRKQMAQRGVIAFGRERQKFRLVESISLNDEFDTWYFDHFHSLFDLFLTRPNNQSFSIRWELIEQSKITYQIISIYSTHGAVQEGRHPIFRIF